MEILCAGFGGQGIIKMGYIIGVSASIYEGKEAVQTQSYGPEARGGACNTGVIISKEKIDFPRVKNADILLVMSQPAFDTFASGLKEGGKLIYDSELVEVKENPKHWELYPIPALKIAVELGKQMFANMVMLGAFSAITDEVSQESLKKSIAANLPPATHEVNFKAFDRGREEILKVKTPS